MPAAIVGVLSEQSSTAKTIAYAMGGTALLAGVVGAIVVLLAEDGDVWVTPAGEEEPDF